MNRPRRAATQQPPPADDTDGARDRDVASDAPRTPAKRTRRAHKSRAGLEKLVDMPLDFIWLLVHKLQPLDLLRLAATCKTLREFFMSRNSVEYWKAAAQNVEGLPAPPERLSWPAYTAFMFSPICQGCGKGGCDNMLWNCFARYCKRCQYEVLTRSSRYDRDAVVTLEAALPVPAIPGEGHYQIALDRLRHALEKISPEEVLRFIEAEAAALRTAEELIPLLKNCKKAFDAAREDDREQARKQRCKSIRKKLVELGWEDELKHMKAQTFRSHRLVAQSKPFTERICNNIRDELVAFIVDHQQDRLYRLHGKVVAERLLTMLKAAEAIHSFDLAGPSPNQAAIAIPQVQQVLRLPSDVAVTEENFAFLTTVLPDFVTQWTKVATKHLAGLINAKLALPTGIDPLSLAVASMFTCKYCKLSLRLPCVLAHSCHKHPKMAYEERNYSKELVKKTFPEGHCTGASFEDEVKLLQRLIELHGLDVKTTTTEQLDNSDVRFTCVRHKEEGAICVMSWFQMFNHHKRNFWNWQCSLDDIQAIPQEQRDLAKPLEQAAWDRKERRLEERHVWKCKHCTKSAGLPKTAIVGHLFAEHHIKTPDENDLQQDRQCDEPLEAVILLDEDKREELELGRLHRTGIEAGIAAFVKLQQ